MICWQRGESHHGDPPEPGLLARWGERLLHAVMWSPFVILVAWLLANLVMKVIGCVTRPHNP